MTIITLTTDFGVVDSYVAMMKGVILGIAPSTRLVDITHEIAAQNVRQAAYVVQSVIPYFPRGTIHIVVVDPGVGSTRRPIAIRIPAGVLVGPDNGVFSYPLAAEGQAGSNTVSAIQLDRHDYWLPEVSQTFHGRDIFAPVGAHLAAGVSFTDLGTPIGDLVRFPVSKPRRLLDGAIKGAIIYSDHFGNLISNIPGDWLGDSQWTIHIAGKTLVGPDATYAAVGRAALLSLVGSGGLLEVAVRDGSAARHLDVGAGEPIELRPRAMGRS
ncbi:MAG: SAM-dependent chlorinase/fluorinase [Chloroflexota bacterium]|nr:SAM-dependent chlorinase/fluorinase [Chloroflexota bacterium]